MITFNISADPRRERTVYSDIEFTSGDIGAYKLCFSFAGIDVSGKTVSVKARRADGSIVICSGTESVVLPSSVYAVPGELELETGIHDGLGNCITACVIIANVREGFGDGGITADDRYPVLTDLIARVARLEAALETAE